MRQIRNTACTRCATERRPKVTLHERMVNAWSGCALQLRCFGGLLTHRGTTLIPIGVPVLRCAILTCVLCSSRELSSLFRAIFVWWNVRRLRRRQALIAAALSEKLTDNRGQWRRRPASGCSVR